MSQSTRHVPVMRDRVIALLAPALDAPGAVLVDATLGLGGHAEHALTSFPDLHLVGLDRDPEALRLSGSACRYSGSGSRSLTPSTTNCRRPSGTWHRRVQESCSTSASRPCSWTRPIAASLTRRTHRSTCEWIPRRISRLPGAEYLLRGRPRAHPASVRRGEVRQSHRRSGSSWSARWNHSRRRHAWST